MRFKTFKTFFFSLLALALLSSLPPTSREVRSDDIYINIGEANIKKSLLAIPSMLYFGTNPSSKANIDVGQELFKVINNDLTVSGFFTLIKPEAFLEDPAKTSLKPAPGDPKGFDFNKWKTIGTEFLIRGGYRVSGDKVSLEIFLYHVPKASLVMGKTYEGSRSSIRTIAHTFADDAIKALTGKRGMFRTKIVASVQSGGVGNKEIYVMDWDGENQKKITDHKSIAISPAWSNNGKKVAYTAFAYHTKAKTRNPDLFIYELETGKRWLVSYRKGQNSGATFLPGDDNLLLTLSQGGTPDIFKMTADGKSLSPLTNGPGKSMNVEPDYSPNSGKVAFSSDRSGKPMVYTMDLDGGSVKRLTFAGKYNANPSWSPDGKKIAFAGYDKGNFDIFVINADGSNLKRLTAATKSNGRNADNEQPSWSPDGRHIVFVSDRTGLNQVYMISPDGSNERRLTYDRNAYFQPKWSPFLD